VFIHEMQNAKCKMQNANSLGTRST
jgi:hypothetical protein